MRILFGRIGNKTAIADHIIKLFPEHKTHVELFVGSGAIYFHKDPSVIEVINDIDKELISGYRLVKQVSGDPTKFTDLDTFDKQHSFYHRTPKTKEDQLTHKILQACNTFGGTGKGDVREDKPSNPFNKMKNIQEYKDRMKNTTVLSQDYKTVIKQYDSKDTLFYLDPPYENSDKLYKNSDMNYEDLSKLLGSIKGKFVLSMNDSKHVRQTFNQFKMKQISVHTQGNKGIGSGGNRKELIIMNF